MCVQRYTWQANQIAAFWLTRHRVVRKTGWRAGASTADAGMKRHGGKGKPAGGMVWSNYVSESLSNDSVLVADEAASATMPVGAPVLEPGARA